MAFGENCTLRTFVGKKEFTDKEKALILAVFDGIEVHPVRDDGTSCEQCELGDNPDFFSTYLHFVENNPFGEVGVICLDDFDTLKEVREAATQLSQNLNIPITYGL